MDEILRYFPDLDSRSRSLLGALEGLYREWNAMINVISRRDMEFFYLHHILHSLSVAAFFRFEKGCRVVDVGCGGGFPSIPLAIIFPEVHFTAVDSVGKKIKVVESVVKELGLTNVEPINCRAESLPARERFDFVVSRAVSAFPDFYALTRKLLNGSFGAGVIKMASKEVTEGEADVDAVGGGELSGSKRGATLEKGAGEVFAGGVVENPLRSGIIYLKGGDFSKELSKFPQAVVLNIANRFSEEFFETKKIIYLPI